MVGRITRAWPLNPILRGTHVSSAHRGHQTQMRTLAFSTTINQGFPAVRVFFVHHVHQFGIDPSPSFHRIQTTHNDLELFVIVVIFVLNLPKVTRVIVHVSCIETRPKDRNTLRFDSDTRHSVHDEFCCDNSLWLADIFRSTMQREKSEHPSNPQP